MNHKIATLALGLVLAIGLTACSTTKRVLTNTTWLKSEDESTLYVGYWEGQCKAMLGCGTGEAHVKSCRTAEDNSMKCEDQPEIDKLLNDK